MRNHAIFFSEDTNFHDPRATDAALDALATLMRRTDATIRIVGFTDERGTSDRNLPLAYARAEKVVAELTRRGINAARLTKVARASVLDISPGSGPSSPNRRVTFETVFVGEGR
jgi:outer membrane protein OmpA-like peptidoglycan-associated protein